MGLMTEREAKLLAALEPRADREGVEIVTVEVVGSKKAPTIRVYIDGADGISFDELAKAQVWVNEIMDEIDPFPGAYVLEVSSPGIDRPLRTVEHFNRFAGQTATVKTSGKIDGSSSFTGKIVGADEDFVVLACEAGEVRLPFGSMKRARLKGVISFNR